MPYGGRVKSGDSVRLDITLSSASDFVPLRLPVSLIAARVRSERRTLEGLGKWGSDVTIDSAANHFD